MSILLPQAGEVFTIRIYKRLSANPSLQWANTYEIETLAGSTTVTLMQVVTRFVAFEKEIHLTDVQFDRAILSTWVPDGQPYDPTTFVSLPQIGAGVREANQPEPLQMTLNVRKDVSLGRFGFQQYRRALNEADVVSVAGTPALANQATYQAVIDAAITASGIDLHFTGGAANELLVMHDGNPSHIRGVSGLTAAGVGVRKFNNRFFDRP